MNDKTLFKKWVVNLNNEYLDNIEIEKLIFESKEFY